MTTKINMEYGMAKWCELVIFSLLLGSWRSIGPNVLDDVHGSERSEPIELSSPLKSFVLAS